MKTPVILYFPVCVYLAVSVAAQPHDPSSSGNARDPLPSWNDGPAKHAILDFVHATTDPASQNFSPPEQRIAVFDQDGTICVEHPLYTQVLFALDRVAAMAAQHPEWKTTEPFKTALSGDKTAIARLTLKDLETILSATHTGMTVDQYHTIVKDWLAKASDKRWGRPYTELVYQPMLELMQYLRDNGYKTYLVTGGGQEFARVFANQVYGIPPEQVIGSAVQSQYAYDKESRGMLMRPPKLLLNDDFSGKPEDVYLFTEQHPKAAFGNSTGDQRMLEYAQAGGGTPLIMLVLHDDAQREYAYGPAQGLPDTKVGTFSQALFTEAGSKGWTVISMKKDWKRVFPFDK
jgi:phosphoglycolate phosphatase-like HAD superfamily hydrolase